MEYPFKEVYFHEYCDTCEHWDLDDVKDPCNECSANGYNFQSHKPVNYKPNEKLVKEKEANKAEEKS